jgi:hypothetical protein
MNAGRDGGLLVRVPPDLEPASRTGTPHLTGRSFTLPAAPTYHFSPFTFRTPGHAFSAVSAIPRNAFVPAPSKA